MTGFCPVFMLSSTHVITTVPLRSKMDIHPVEAGKELKRSRIRLRILPRPCAGWILLRLSTKYPWSVSLEEPAEIGGI